MSMTMMMMMTCLSRRISKYWLNFLVPPSIVLWIS